MRTLKEKEKRILTYIRQVTEESGYSPTVRDIQSALGYKSTSTVQMYLDRLTEYGYLTRENGKSRSVRPVQELNGKVPLVGTVTAGQPILAEELFEGYVTFGAEGTGYDRKNLFALRVRGESMIEAGILNGDIVVVDRRSYAENGEIVVAMVDEEATVKAFYRENGHFRLQPRNHTMQPIYADEVQILGKVIAVLRYY